MGMASKFVGMSLDFMGMAWKYKIVLSKQSIKIVM